MRYAISIPQLHPGAVDGAGLRRYLARAEELGFTGGWVMEQLVGPAPMVAPLQMLAYAAACTERLRLGVGVLVGSLHDPLALAGAATAVDRLSGGRLDLGVAVGGASRAFAAFGVSRGDYLRYFTEGIDLMKAAWSDEAPLRFAGRYRRLDGLVIEPKPVQRPHPPLWFGGAAPAAMRRAARLGDAYLGAGSASTGRFADAVRTLRDALDARGRDPAGFPVAKRVYLCVDDDAGRARRRVAAGVERIYGRPVDVAQAAVAGTPAEVVEGLARVIEAGAQMIVLNPVGAQIGENHEQMERLAAEVLPRLDRHTGTEG